MELRFGGSLPIWLLILCCVLEGGAQLGPSAQHLYSASPRGCASDLTTWRLGSQGMSWERKSLLGPGPQSPNISAVSMEGVKELEAFLPPDHQRVGAIFFSPDLQMQMVDLIKVLS